MSKTKSAILLVGITGRCAAASVAIGLLATAGPPARAGVSPIAQEDIQCLLLSNGFSKGEKDAKLQQAAIFAHFYYLGRLSHEIAVQDMTTALQASQKSLPPGLAGKAMQLCATMMFASETDADRAGKQVQAAQGK